MPKMIVDDDEGDEQGKAHVRGRGSVAKANPEVDAVQLATLTPLSSCLYCTLHRQSTM